MAGVKALTGQRQGRDDAGTNVRSAYYRVLALHGEKRLSQMRENSAMTWSLDSSIRYEVARDTLRHVIAIHMADLYAEQEKAAPDRDRIASLSASVDALHQQLTHLRMDNVELVEQVIKDGGQFVRSRHPRSE